LHLVADVDFRGRVLAHEDDAEARRTSGLRGERLHRRQRARTNLRRDRRPVEQSRAHRRLPSTAAAARSRRPAAPPMTTRSPAEHSAAWAGGFKSILPVARRMPTSTTPYL